MRSAVTVVFFALLLQGPGLVVQAQKVRLSDGTYASTAAYLEGQPSNPPKVVEQPFEATSANVFMSDAERWDRMK